MPRAEEIKKQGTKDGDDTSSEGVDSDGDVIMKVSLNIINNLFLPVMCGIVVYK